MRFLVPKSLAAGVYQTAIILGNLAVAAALLICAYLGTFTRYLADDYCQSVFLIKSNTFQATIRSYIVWSDRYSNLFLIQLIEWGGKWGMQLMAATTLIVWVVGLTWLVSEIGKSIQLQWNPGNNSWMAGLVIFLSLMEAPNLYQVLYWRAGLITYLAPLVIFAYIAAFFLWQVRTVFQKFRLFGTGLVCFVLIFFAGGSSETTTALQIGILILALLFVFLQKKINHRSEVLKLLGVSLASALLSLLVMVLAPGNGVRLNTPTSNVILLTKQTVIYTAQFIWLTLRTLPLPSMISLIIPFLIVNIHSSQDKETQPQIPSSALWLTAAIIPVVLFITIAFSFAPSAFAQSYPVDRARYPAHFLMTMSLAVEGGVLAILTGKIHLPLKLAYIIPGAGLVLCLLALYPVRAAYNLFSVAEPEYQSWAVAWDVRQGQIFAEKAQGIKDLVVPHLPGIGYVKELDSSPNYWVNKCAEKFYGIESLKAIRFDP
jgi:Family of unknown function (DUF6056)